MFFAPKQSELGRDYTPPQIINSVLLSREKKIELLTGLREEVAGTWYTRDGVVFSLEEIDQALRDLQVSINGEMHRRSPIQHGMIGL